jgi:two-component system sensor histidine kinase RstB
MRRLYFRLAAGVVVASLVGWGAVAVVVPLLIGRVEENGFRAPIISGGIRLIAAGLDAAPRDEWPARLQAARQELAVPLTIVSRADLPAGVEPRLRRTRSAVVGRGRGAPTIYVALANGTDVLVADPLPPLPLEPLITTAAIFALVLTVTASAAVGFPLVRRLRRLHHAIAELGRGNLATRLDPNEGELSELAESINRMASQLQQQFQEREALLQAVSHEMGTPLSRMRFAIELLEEDLRGKAHAQRLRALVADLDELDRLSSELLAWMETDASGPSKQPFRVSTVLESLVELECQAGTGPVQVDLRVPAQLTVNADQRQFQRAIENLLRNALRYAQAHIVVTGEIDGDRLVLEVRDDGPGIAKDLWTRVFDPFVRLEGGRSHAHRGLGLGLAIVRRIAEAHGGSVSVGDAPEGGTRVTTIWPGASSTLDIDQPGGSVRSRLPAQSQRDYLPRSNPGRAGRS